ncbi:MAG: phosphoribosylformylglycinamidine synthase subunit PurL [Anaerolineales bacterium]
MPVYRFIVRFRRADDPRSVGLLADAHALGFTALTRLECQDLVFIEGQLSPEECQQLALSLLIDPLTQVAEWRAWPAPPADPPPGALVVEVALRPGVTDPVADEIVRAAGELGFAGLRRASTGLRFVLEGLQAEAAERLADGLLANGVIQRWTVGEIPPSFPQQSASSGEVAQIPLRQADAEGLLAVSRARRAALDLAEMQAIQAYFRRQGREPTDVEFETIAQTWSEHCVHKTFKALIEVEDLAGGQAFTVNGLFQTYIRAATEKIAAPWVLSAFVDNAGIIDLDGENEISFKVETHNHPSAIEPFGGANTGVGGVIRDVLGVSHKPVANTDVLCFGMQTASCDDLPAGVLHPRRILSGVVAGVQDYGNKMGIPTVNGAILFDPGYAANPLVFCGTVGIAPRRLHPRQPRRGDRVVVLGGGTGRDGLRGATFSSMTMDAQTGEVAGASVQIGNPIVEKGLVDVILPARDRRLYTAITDCGAGGLSSAVGEMAAGLGCEVELAHVRLKYPGLAPWEIWLSEAQERMVLAVPPQNLPALRELCAVHNVDLMDLGEFTGSGRLVVRYRGRVVLDLDNQFLHHGLPQRRLRAVVGRHPPLSSRPSAAGETVSASRLTDSLLALLAHPNIASKAEVIRIYDHEVQGGTAVKPLTGVQMDAPSDACVLRPLGARGQAGIALANGINPEYGKRDAYRMAMAVVDEAVRNLVAVGADPGRIALLDNFCWGDPLRPETLGALVEAARGCHDAALLFGAPFISGKDSLNNEYLGADGQRHAIPPTLLISSIGVMADVRRAVTMDLKEAGNLLYLAGEFAPTFGGSHFDLIASEGGRLPVAGEPVPAVSAVTPRVYAALHRTIAAGLVRAAHDLSEGGLAVAAAEMCIGGRLGLDLDLPPGDPLRLLFGETTGCLLVEVAPQQAEAFEAAFHGLPLGKLGRVAETPALTVSAGGRPLFRLPVSDLVAAWNTPLR